MANQYGYGEDYISAVMQKPFNYGNEITAKIGGSTATYDPKMPANWQQLQTVSNPEAFPLSYAQILKQHYYGASSYDLTRIERQVGKNIPYRNSLLSGNPKFVWVKPNTITGYTPGSSGVKKHATALTLGILATSKPTSFIGAMATQFGGSNEHRAIYGY